MQIVQIAVNVRPSSNVGLFMYSNVTNLLHSIKYMTRSTFESIKFDPSNLGRPKNEVRVVYMGKSTVERLRFRRRTSHVPNKVHAFV